MKDGHLFSRRDLLLVVFLVVLGLGALPSFGQAQAVKIDPQAEKTLKRMTDYLGSLRKFSVSTQVTLEDLLASGHRVDSDVSTNVVISRPNRLRAERKGDGIEQVFYYDGKVLTLHNTADKLYATEVAPGTIEELLHFASDSLGLMIPAADLVYRDAFQLLMRDVNFATVIGKTFIGGVKCDHLLFSRPGVDFQVWVAEGARPLPYKYVVTDTASAARISVSTVMSKWNVAPAVADGQFKFVPTKGARSITFLRQESSGVTSR